jgi:hypothetical protein
LLAGSFSFLPGIVFRRLGLVSILILPTACVAAEKLSSATSAAKEFAEKLPFPTSAPEGATDFCGSDGIAEAMP